MWQSTNPALANDDAFEQYYGRQATAEQADVTTLQGVVNKTAILLVIAVLAGTFGYWMIGQVASGTFVTISCFVSMGVCFGAYMVLRGNPAHARWLAPIYAVTEGTFLGAFSGALDGWLSSMNLLVAGGVAVQAFIITISIMMAMLGLYYLRILRPTRKLVAMVSVATAGIMITYLISWPVGLLLGRDLPLIGLSSAFGSGWTPLIGIGINVFILGIASLWLIIDFGMVEEKVAAAAPKHMEWYLGFALLVTLAWIYYEAVKLAFRLAILLGNRN